MDKLTFWTVFKADLLFSLCSIVVMTTVTVLFSIWKRRKSKSKSKGTAGGPPPAPFKGPRAFMIGGTDPAPGHCPLCGQGWPLAGPGSSKEMS